MKYTEEAMRARFHECVDTIEKVRAKAAPLREAYERKRNEIAEKERKELKPIIDKMKAAEGPLFDLQNEAAALARALKGQTGERPAAA